MFNFTNKMKMNKKGIAALDGFGALAIGTVTLAVVLIVGFLIVAEGQAQLVTLDSINVSDATTFSAGYNATVTLQDAMNDIPGWVPIIIITAIGAILIGMVAVFRRLGR